MEQEAATRLGAFIDAMQYSVIAFSIVFASLFTVIVVIKIFLVFDAQLEKLDQKKKKVEEAPKAQNIDNTTLVLISASVAAVLKSKAKTGRIRKIASLARHGSTWADAGRITLLGSHNINKRD
jgi:NADH:ubiquinone oxidoreductase subunit 5 (subunit L)/multisubunit Na+/H+ antiporter MnhA subunit